MRVHELAKELGMTNAEMMSLCDVMGVGVKSHSSTLIEAQADRLRRRAERDGLTRPEQPEEAKPARKGKKAAAGGGGTATATMDAPPAPTTPKAPSETPAPAGNGAPTAEPVAPAPAAPGPRSERAAGSPVARGGRAACAGNPRPHPRTRGRRAGGL